MTCPDAVHLADDQRQFWWCLLERPAWDRQWCGQQAEVSLLTTTIADVHNTVNALNDSMDMPVTSQDGLDAGHATTT